MLPLPVMLELAVTRQHWIESEIHAAHVERCHLGREKFRSLDALVDRHALTAARGDVDDGRGLLLDARQEAIEDRRVARWLSGFRIAGMKMQDRGAGFRSFHSLRRDLIR